MAWFKEEEISNTSIMSDQEGFINIKEVDENGLTINVIEEVAHIHKEVVERGTVRISKKVHEANETIKTSLNNEEVQVEKIPVNKYVDSYPEVRYEGETMIVPVIKEVAVVEKKLLLVEEVHIIRRTITSQEEQILPLRHEEIIVERFNNDNPKI